jgi:hypothetical protein
LKNDHFRGRRGKKEGKKERGEIKGNAKKGETGD